MSDYWVLFQERIVPIVLKIVVLLGFLFLFMPIFTIIYLSFSPSTFPSFPIHEFSLRWYQDLLMDSTIRAPILNSVIIATSCVILSMAIGTTSAYVFVRYSFPGKNLLQALIFAPLVIPHLIIGVAILGFFSSLGIHGSIPLVIMGHVLLATPYVFLVVSSTLYGFDPSMEEAAMVLGASRIETFLRITLPLIKPGVVSAAFFAFITSFNEFDVSFLLSGAGEMTVPLKVYAMLRFGITPNINALATFLVLFATLFALIAAFKKIKIFEW